MTDAQTKSEPDAEETPEDDSYETSETNGTWVRRPLHEAPHFVKDKVDLSKIQLPKPGEGYKVNMEAAKEKFRNYWAHKNTGRPLMCVIARRPEVEQYSDGTPVEGGYLDQMSFAFTVNKQEYDRAKHLRRITGFKRVFDVAAVDIPAYDGTSIAARSWAKAEAEREHAEADKRRRLELKLKTYGITKEEK